MSLYGVMRTSTSGMSAQASRISAVAENVANANTVGYKNARTEFESIFIENNISNYNSGSVNVDVHRMVGNQGTLSATGSVTDIAIEGDGFLLVRGNDGENFMTRAGSFLPDGDGLLVNTAGFSLLGYPLANGSPSVVVNGYTGLVPVTVNDLALIAEASDTGNFSANLPANATPIAPAELPSNNASTSKYTAKSSLVVFGNLGEEITLDIYFAKSSTGNWQMAAYDAAGSASANQPFPYASGPLATTNLLFDASSGQLAAASPAFVDIAVPNGQTIHMDLANMSQLSTDYVVLDAKVNGNPASASEIVEISDDGMLFVSFADGTRRAMFQVPIASVPSPDNLAAITGNVFAITSKSGDLRIGFPGDAGQGKLLSGVLEQSTTDIASEFTDMIDAQRGYTANSKVFQTGAELMDVLVNLKR